MNIGDRFKQKQAFLFCRIHQDSQLFRRCGKWLFAHHMLIGIQCLQGIIKVHVIGNADIDKINLAIRQHACVIGIQFVNRILITQLLPFGFARFANAQRFTHYVIDLCQSIQTHVDDVTCTYHTYTHKNLPSLTFTDTLSANIQHIKA